MKWKISLSLAVFFIGSLAVLYVSLLSYDFNRLKPDIVAAVKSATGRELVIKGDIKVAIGIFPALVVEDVSLQNADWGSPPRMLQIERFELQLALLPLFTGTLEIRKASLIDAEIFLEVNPNGILNLPDIKIGSRDAPEPKDTNRPFLPQIALKKVRIIDSRLIFKGRLAKRPVVLRINRLRLKSVAPGGKARFDLAAAYNNQPLAAKGSIGSVNALLDPEKPWPLKLTLNSVGSKMELVGAIKNVFLGRGMALDIKIASRDVSKTVRTAGLSLPFKAAARLSGHLSGGLATSLKLSRMKLQAAGHEVQGFVLAKLQGGKPYFNAALTAERLDLRPAAKRKATAGKQRIFSAKPFPTGLLSKVDADVGLSIKKCLFARSAMQNLKLKFVLKNGRLALKPITAIVGDGKLQGSAVIRQIKRKLAIRAALDIAHLNAGRMLKELDISDALEGEFDVSVNLSGRGRSAAELMAGANGHMYIIMGKGLVNNRLLGVIGGDLRAGLFQLLYPGGQVGDITDINCFVTRFDAVEGLAAARVLVLDTGALRVIGEGTINLKTEQLDISLKPIPKKGIGTLGKINLSLGNLARPFKLGGTLAAPELAIDAKRAAITLGKAFGGFVLLGPFGLAASLIDGDTSKTDLCATAAAIARQKRTPPPKPAPQRAHKKKKGTGPPGTFLDGVKKMFE